MQSSRFGWGLVGEGCCLCLVRVAVLSSVPLRVWGLGALGAPAGLVRVLFLPFCRSVFKHGQGDHLPTTVTLATVWAEKGLGVRLAPHVGPGEGWGAPMPSRLALGGCLCGLGRAYTPTASETLRGSGWC